MKKSTIQVFLIMSLGASCSSQITQNEGIVSYTKHIIKSENNPFSKANDVRENKIWFLDSAVIYERKGIIESEEGDGTNQKREYGLFKYTYLDLRNMTCQDYYNFGDTALPFCNYNLKNNEMISWKFYEGQRSRDTGTAIQNLSDTFIKGVKYKRLKTVNYSPDGYEYIYYLRCDLKSNYFHISKVLDDKFIGCKVVRDELVNSNSELEHSFEFNLIKDKLTSSEKAVFLSWSKNAKETKLPLLTLSESEKSCWMRPKSLR